MLKIAFCITELDIGGAERCLVELATRIDRRRFEAVVYCLGPRPTDERSSLAVRLEAAGVEVHCLGAAALRSAPRILRTLTRHWRETKPDIVCTFLFHANFMGRLAARRAGVRHVACGIRVAERAARWHLRLDRWTSRWVERYVCVSRSVADFSREVGGLPAEKLLVIPNGIDPARYENLEPADLTALGVPKGRRALTFVGRLCKQKGVDWLIEVAPRLLAAVPDHDLLLVGDGSMRAVLEAQCRPGEVHSRIHFAGWQDDTPRILKASDLLIVPSRWEGMPNVVLEAMASGTLVLATDVEGVGELLGPGAEAQTVSFGDTESLIAKATARLDDPAGAGILTRENTNRVRERFSLDAMVAAYERLFVELTGG